MACAPSDYFCLIANCSGRVGTGEVLFDYWRANDCPAAYSAGINTTADGIFQYNPTSQADVQAQVTKLFANYQSTNTITDDITSSGYNNFQNTLLNLCIDPALPGICDQALTDYCAPFSRDDVINSSINTNFCGCYVPPDPVYLSYTLGSPGCLIGSGCTAGCKAGDPGCTGQPACDPLCHRALTVQKAYQPTGNAITCPQSICVIDDVIINADNSRVPGGINFNNFCSACGGAGSGQGDGCLCVISGVDISLTATQIGLGINFNQFCGGNSVCLIESNGQTVIQDCQTIDPANIPVPVPFYPPNAGIIVVVFLAVIIIFFACLAASRGM